MKSMPQEDEVDLLIGTDCISEGQNLQDCDYLIKGRRNNKTSHLIGPDYQIQTESLLTVGLPIQREQLG
jgi:hypothetical protein